MAADHMTNSALGITKTDSETSSAIRGKLCRAPWESFAFPTPTVGIVFGVVDARFVEIDPLMYLKLR